MAKAVCTGSRPLLYAFVRQEADTRRDQKTSVGELFDLDFVMNFGLVSDEL